jgi:hypothetical protein
VAPGIKPGISGSVARNSNHDHREVMGLERGPLSLVSITEELLEWKSSGSRSRKPRLTAVESRCADNVTPSISKFGTNFAEKQRSLGRYSSLAD